MGLAAMLALVAPGAAGATVIAWSNILPIFPGSLGRDYGRMDFSWADEAAVLQAAWPSILPFRPWEQTSPFPPPSPLPLGHPFGGSVMDQFSWNFQLLLAHLGALGQPPPAAVPEPGAAPLAGLAAAALAALRRRRRTA